MVKLLLYNRQKTHRPDLPWLRRILKSALPHCLAEAKSPQAPLSELEEIEFTIISDDEIAEVHAEFLEDPTPTDVITFHHGEILVSADTALRQGAEHGQTLNEELALYLIHGLMHLGGWDDHEAEEAAEMTRRQEAIHRRVLSEIPRLGKSA
ncbi:rRNA maturation RNase YbeY [Prosthecobacter dejongeii]|uniref:Endoribonuclease YbeY n=1 Tax=Prosthecobacter dejongeii TaxID=48465 RepID=A0A7W7YQI6_9BACT|nr:rRNA maturation RNase YbeY [Prosthecobacter dejongeii]MBB5040379.1 putative rRNA maturation factor [Prosthecobacter dejongeii]